MHNKCEHSDTHVMTTAQTTECVFAHTHREMDTHIHSNTLTNCKDNLYNYASQLALIFWQLTCICSWIKPIYTQHTFAHNTCAITLIHINSWGARNNHTHTHTHLHSHIQTDSKHKCSNNYNMFAFYKTIAQEIDACSHASPHMHRRGTSACAVDRLLDKRIPQVIMNIRVAVTFPLVKCICTNMCISLIICPHAS